jgi:Asp-tRNA(Asn)/Glu-tRNA(Gln) amidotransferase A subunit family amidase
MSPADYEAEDAVGLAALIAKGEITASEALEAAMARAEAVNDKINAITFSMAEAARAAAREIPPGPPQAPLGGVPFLLKDLSAQAAGTPTSAGSRLFQDVEYAADNAIVAAYRRAGLVIFGKTNTPEFGLEPVTEPELFGPSRNPWDLAHTPGGSSGGSAAAVAAGVVPAAHASDGGGSIRIPASCCGLFGMKPSRGRVSLAPANEGWGGFSIQHAVTRSVRDSAVLLDAISTPQPGDPYWAPPHSRPFAEEVGAPPGKLKIGFSVESIAGSRLDPPCADAVRAAARLCEDLGHCVEEVALGWDYAPVQEAGGLIITANITTLLDNEARRRGRPIQAGEVEDLTLGMYQRGQNISAADYIRAIQTAHAFGRLAARAFQGFDLLLTSTLGAPPPPIGYLRDGEPSGYMRRLLSFMPNTQPFNVSGQPAMTVPLSQSAEGLPIGVQFVGQPAGEALLFRLAGQLEEAAPWAARRPVM